MFSPFIRRRSSTVTLSKRAARSTSMRASRRCPSSASEVALGQSLYNGTGNTDAKRARMPWSAPASSGCSASTPSPACGTCSARGWRDKEGRTLRLVHGLLMMAADVGFVATSAGRPTARRGIQDPSTPAEPPIATSRLLRSASERRGTCSCSSGIIDVLSHLLESWASLYANHAALRTGVEFLHLGGLVAGGGCAITADLATIAAARDRPRPARPNCTC